MYDIYIASPAGLATGGPELLHQLCNTLNKNGFNAFMYYTNALKGENPVPEPYICYHNKYVTELEDSEHNIVVIPETMFDLYCHLKKCHKFFWWLSVDFFWSSVTPNYLRRGRKIIAIIEEKIGKNSISSFIDFKLKKIQQNIIENKIDILRKDTSTFHITQSKYAEKYCVKIGVDMKKIMYLSDYLNQDFLNNVDISNKKENIVLYNPKKGWEFTKKIIDKAEDITWVPLIGLTRNQMIDYLKRAKVYIDFGNHPGKDRIPREACVCRCIVITGRRGSANYYDDVPINENYKFEDTEDNIDEIINCIKDSFENYDEKIQDFDLYRKYIYAEKEKFEVDVMKVFSKI